MFRLTGDSAGVAANALPIIDDESKIDHRNTSRVGAGLVTRCRTLILAQVHNILLPILLIVASGFVSYLQDYLQHFSNSEWSILSRIVDQQLRRRPTTLRRLILNFQMRLRGVHVLQGSRKLRNHARREILQRHHQLVEQP